MRLSQNTMVRIAALALLSSTALPILFQRTLPSVATAQTEDIDDDVEEDIEDEIDGAIEEEVDSDIDEEIDDAIEDEVASDIDEEVDDAIEDEVANHIDEEVDGAIEDEVANDIDEEVDGAIEDEVANDIDEEVDGAIEDEVANDLDEEVDGAFEDEIDDALNQDIDADVADELENEAEDIEDSPEFDEDENHEDEDHEDLDEEETEDGDIGDSDEDSDSTEEPNQADEYHDPDTLQVEIGDDGERFARNEVLVLATREEMAALRAAGLGTDDIVSLDSLALQIARVSDLSSRSFADLEALVQSTAPNAEIDRNHLYKEQEGSPLSAYPTTEDQFEKLKTSVSEIDTGQLRIGLIDSHVDALHPALTRADITQKDFVRRSRPRPMAHGTAVASILIGDTSTYSGLVPRAKLTAASVFFETPDGLHSATTRSLVEALDWLSAQDLHVINMSLSGPPNAILERAIARAAERGNTLVAAVGNQGPTAPIQFPAGYDEVIGVTAVSANNRVYRLASRGAHVDFAAPGVSISSAQPGNAFGASTGTSFAAPIVSAIIAREKLASDGPDPIGRLKAAAMDLGASGFDTVYGHGLIQPLQRQPAHALDPK